MEEWKPVIGFEDWYEVSNLGRVRNIKNRQGTSINRVLKPMSKKIPSRPNRRWDRPKVGLSVNGRLFQKPIAQLVALAFLGPKEPWQTINHKNGNADDDRADNLEYISMEDNIRHAFRLGLMHPSHGESHHKAKLTTEQVIVIRKCSAPKRMIARVFGINHKTVRQIQNGDIWKHL